MGGLMLKHLERTHRGGTSQTSLSSWGGLSHPKGTSYTGRKRRQGQARIDPDPGDVLHASADASWRSSWAGHSDTPTFLKCIQLGLLVSLLTCFHRPPCSRTTCLLDIAWLGNLAG